MNKLLKILFSLFISIILLFAFALPLNPPAGNWYQQFMPSIGNRSIQDVFFLDSLTGWAVTNATNQATDTIFVLKTTNSGDNWIIHYRKLQTGGGFPGYTKVYFLNQNTGFASSVTGFDKTTNGGMNWTSLLSGETFQDFSSLNTDTIWLVSINSLTGGVFRTTNGGANWQNQINLGSQNPNHIYMFNGRIGFICEDNTYLRRTTDGGASWNVVPGTGGFLDIHFTDSLTGWKTSFQKTTDGGLTWVNQVLPSGGYILSNLITSFSNINKDTIWANGGFVLFPNNQARSILNRTTNGGQNWLFQIPDTSKISNIVYYYMNFVNKNNGWATDNNPLRGGIHTTNGGDTTFYTGIQQISTNIPKDFELKQNYPNPFNPRTVIPYKIRSAGYVTITAYDMLGRESQKLVSSRHTAGEYEVDFMGKFSASGVYFYRMEVIDDKSKQVYTETKKMVLVK